MKKGFTLIELLAVIVILAIIALIATPIILGIINNAKEESDKRSVELYVKAAELAVARENLKGEFKPTECKVKYGVCKCKVNDKDITLNVEMDNASNLSGKIIFNEKGVVISNTLSTDPLPKVYENGEVVYFNVKDGVKCSENDYNWQNSRTGYNGINPTDYQTSCLKFYAFNDTDESDKVNLLLDHNTTATVAWNSSNSNTSGPNELLTQLATDTKDWNTPTPTSYTSPSYGYTVNYTKARLITAQEIAEITGKTGWDVKTAAVDDWYYFDTLSWDAPTEYKYGWLYDRTYAICENYGCLNNDISYSAYGYWTISECGLYDNSAWDIGFQGYISYGTIDGSWNRGVRPVIEVSKSSLN